MGGQNQCNLPGWHISSSYITRGSAGSAFHPLSSVGALPSASVILTLCEIEYTSENTGFVGDCGSLDTYHIQKWHSAMVAKVILLRLVIPICIYMFCLNIQTSLNISHLQYKLLTRFMFYMLGFGSVWWTFDCSSTDN